MLSKRYQGKHLGLGEVPTVRLIAFSHFWRWAGIPMPA
jgi:hypothetical protein